MADKGGDGIGTLIHFPVICVLLKPLVAIFAMISALE
jgi:hypothetical protein